MLKNWSEGKPKTILLATDRSARCDRPLDRAVQLAHDWNAMLVVLHVVERLPEGVDKDALASDLKARLFDEMPSRDVRFRVEVRFGTVGDAVLAAAGDAGADLIISGVARYDDVGDYVLGTTVDRLVRASPVPVLVVKTRPRTGYAKLLIATDFSDCSARALDVLPAFRRADATLMYAYHVHFGGSIGGDADEAEFREQVEAEASAFLDRFAPDVRRRLTVANRHGEPGYVLVKAVREEGFELTVIGTHGRSGLGHAIIGSTAEELLNRLPCDVLVVPAAR